MTSLLQLPVSHLGHVAVLDACGIRCATPLWRLKRSDVSCFSTSFKCDGNSNGMGDLDIHVGVAGFVFLVAISDFTARISAYGVRADINSVEFSTLCTTQFTCLQEEVPYLQVTQRMPPSKRQTTPKLSLTWTHKALSGPTGTIPSCTCSIATSHSNVHSAVGKLEVVAKLHSLK